MQLVLCKTGSYINDQARVLYKLCLICKSRLMCTQKPAPHAYIKESRPQSDNEVQYTLVYLLETVVHIP